MDSKPAVVDCTCRTPAVCYCYDNGHTGEPGQPCLVCGGET